MRVADQRHPLPPLSESAGLFHREEGLAAARAAAHLDARQQADGVEDDGLVFGQRIGGALVAERPGDDVALR